MRTSSVAMATIEIDACHEGLRQRVPGRRRRLARDRGRRVRRPRRAVGLRQVDAPADAGGARGGDARHRCAIDGADVTDLAPRHRDIAMVFQNYALYPHMTVRENLGYGLKVRQGAEGRDAAPRRARSPDLLGLDELLDRKPGAALGRPAPAGRDGPRDRARAAGVPDGRAAVEPRRKAARRDARVARAAPREGSA